MVRTKQIAPYILAVSVAIPGIYVHLAGIHLGHQLQAILAGTAIMGASFILLWACDAAQKDISQTLALAVVALIAVLPEYAVDMYFTWQAGQYPESDYANYAIANMTGANRLLIGVAWALIAVIAYIRTRKAVTLEKERRTEIFFLALATVYALVVVAKGALTWIDAIVFLGLFVWYVIIAAKRPCEDCEIEGPAVLVASLPKVPRRVLIVILFSFAAGAILANAEAFCEGLIGTGKVMGINEFLLVQWLAPLASEMPEFVVAIMFALRGHGSIALGSLVSAKLNQWTLLVGMIPGVYAVSAGTLDHPIPFGSFQMGEIYLTAAQSLMAVVLVATLRLSLGNAILLFALFAGQLMSPLMVNALPGHTLAGLHPENMHRIFAWAYMGLAVYFFLRAPRNMADLRLGLKR